MRETISKADLISVGYSAHKSSEIIRCAKFYMVKSGYDFYQNKRLGRVPIRAVEHVIGFNPFIEKTLE